MNLESWEYWYPRKEGTVESELLTLERILKEKNLSRVLDFGCGAGRHTLHLARNGLEVYGFDASAPAVKRATQLLHDEGLRADFKVHDMLKPLPYPDTFFDAVLATRVIHHTLAENIKRIVSEVNRVLKKGGYVLLQVPEYGDHEWVLRKARSTHRVLEHGTHVPLEGVENGVPHHCFTRDELLGLFSNYKPVEIHANTDYYHGFCFLAEKDSVITGLSPGNMSTAHRNRLDRSPKGRKKKESRLPVSVSASAGIW